MNKYERDVAYSYGYELVCLDNNFSKPFQSYLSEDAVYNLINNLIKEIKYGNDMMKKHFG